MIFSKLSKKIKKNYTFICIYRFCSYICTMQLSNTQTKKQNIMTTVREIFESINVEELRKQQEEENKGKDEFFVTVLNDNQLISTNFYMIIWNRIKSVSKRVDTREVRKGIILNETYYWMFDNTELINSLRQLYSATKNNFVKEVVKTVGQTKRMSEKQADIIIEEMMKFNLTLNF